MYTAILLSVICLASALLTEGLSWYFIYRTDDYQRLKSSLESLQSKLDKRKEIAPTAPTIAATLTTAAAANSKKDKDRAASRASKDARRLSELEQQVKAKQQLIASARFKSTIIVTFALIALYQLLSRTYYGLVIAHIPFEPIRLVQGISHRGLDGEDWTLASFSFIYALSQLGIRANVTRWFDFVPRDQAGFAAFMPEDKDSKSQ